MRPSLGALVAIALVGCAFAWPMQGRSLGELSNYALVKALSSGTPRIDETRFEVGDLPAGDFRTFRGHTFSDKAPGLALVTVPWYVGLRAIGLRTHGDPTEALWALRLWGTVIPGVLLLLISWRLAERIAPGYGAATAVAIGTGTLILPFATLFYSHVLAACLVLATFAILWREHDGPARLALVAAAGCIAGFAVATEYPTALAALAYGFYALSRRPYAPRGTVYAAGVVVGLTPLLLYNRWAFGSFTHLSYFGDELSSGNLAGRMEPSLLNGLFTYASLPGLLVLSPFVACGLVGIVLLYAAGRRPEALVIAFATAAFTIYNASLPGLEYDAFVFGPRYLVPILPLAALPAALTFQRRPFTTAALGLVSAILMSVLTATQLHAGKRLDPNWFAALLDRSFPSTATTLVGITGWYAILPFFFTIGGAIVAAALSTPAPAAEDQVLAAFAVLAWGALALFAPADADADSYSSYFPVLLALAAFMLVVAAAHTLRPREGRVRVTQ